MAGNVKLMTSAGGGVVLDTATTTATDVTVKVPVTGVNNGTLVCSDSSGNVGIGTSSPTAPLDIKIGTGNFTVGLQGAANTQITASGNLRFNSTAGTTVFTQNGTESMRIDSSGNLLVGTTATGGWGTTFKFTSETASGWAVSAYRSGAGSEGAFICRVDNTNNILTSWRYGTAVVGSVTTNGTTTAYNTSSDYRLKENLQPMQGALAVVQQLNPVTYTWKADGSDGQGFIAHELQAVVPDCVTGEKDAVDEEGNPVYQGIDTSFLVATLTKAIQELSAKNDALEARIATLEAK